MRVHSNNQLSFNDIRHVAVAVAVVREGQLHVGILHKEELAGEVKLAHLAWHNQLKEENDPKDCYLWIDPPIPQRRARQVAARCRQILRANVKGIPYAFSPPNDCFDAESGTFLLGPSRVGLTCATFVLAVFDSSGMALANYSTWPARRSGDVAWQKFVADQLLESGAANEHLQLVRQELGSVRFRPEDVAGCAASDQIPCRFERAESLGGAIVDRLSLHAKPLRDS